MNKQDEKHTCPYCGESTKYLNARDNKVYSKIIGVEYPYGDPNRYDGVSEWLYPCCGARVGRWTGKVLAEGEAEPRFGQVSNDT